MSKNVIITGTSRGIGLELIKLFSNSGFNVLSLSRNITNTEKLNLNNTSFLPFDITKENDHLLVNKFISKNWKSVDILINNAGTNRPAKLIDTKIEDFDYVMSLNVRSVISLTKLVVKKMLDSNIKGSIINVSSQMGHVGGPNRTTYCSSKFAIEGFTKSLAIELGPDGIRVNAICPTFIQTPMTEPFLKDEDFKKATVGMIPIGRLGEVTDLMGPFVFLASEASSLMTGSSILVDGGWTAR